MMEFVRDNIVCLVVVGVLILAAVASFTKDKDLDI